MNVGVVVVLVVEVETTMVVGGVVVVVVDVVAFWHPNDIEAIKIKLTTTR